MPGDKNIHFYNRFFMTGFSGDCTYGNMTETVWVSF